MSAPGAGPGDRRGSEPSRQRGTGAPRPAAAEETTADWLSAVLLGIRDTAKSVLDEARKGAKEAYDEGWERFETKTRRRRHKGS